MTPVVAWCGAIVCGALLSACAQGADSPMTEVEITNLCETDVLLAADNRVPDGGVFPEGEHIQVERGASVTFVLGGELTRIIVSVGSLDDRYVGRFYGGPQIASLPRSIDEHSGATRAQHELTGVGCPFLKPNAD